MPIWVSFLIGMALKLGLPWLEKHVPPRLAALIEQILKIIQAAPTQSQGVQLVEDHLNKLVPPIEWAGGRPV